jgi:hypothetical protein
MSEFLFKGGLLTRAMLQAGEAPAGQVMLEQLIISLLETRAPTAASQGALAGGSAQRHSGKADAAGGEEAREGGGEEAREGGGEGGGVAHEEAEPEAVRAHQDVSEGDLAGSRGGEGGGGGGLEVVEALKAAEEELARLRQRNAQLEGVYGVCVCVCMCVCVCVCMYTCAFVRAYVRVCVRACVP